MFIYLKLNIQKNKSNFQTEDKKFLISFVFSHFFLLLIRKIIIKYSMKEFLLNVKEEKVLSPEKIHQVV